MATPQIFLVSKGLLDSHLLDPALWLKSLFRIILLGSFNFPTYFCLKPKARRSLQGRGACDPSLTCPGRTLLNQIKGLSEQLPLLVPGTVAFNRTRPLGTAVRVASLCTEAA